MNKKLDEFYGETFYEVHGAGMFSSAEIILRKIFKLYTPKSVIDFGCGQGAWLSAAESFGATNL